MFFLGMNTFEKEKENYTVISFHSYKYKFIMTLEKKNDHQIMNGA